MNLLLQRTHTSTNGLRTFGKLYDDGVFLCYTLEDRAREVAGVPVLDWKIKGSTAIPSTEYVGHPYLITLEYSPRFGADTITVNAVPDFSGVRMHAGNDEDDTEGCPLLGMTINEAGIVGGTSRQAVELVKQLLKTKRLEREAVFLDINNVTALA